MGAPPQALTSLAAGRPATVTSIDLPPEDRARIQEMGLVVGTAVELVRYAPLGDPLEIKVRGYYLTLHRSEAEQIRVCPVSA
jgi:ferrous iron transport protein A